MSTLESRLYSDMDTERERPISTGFAPIDNITNGGIRRGAGLQLNSIPGYGKTSLGCNLCWNIAEASDNKILFISTEMIASDILCKMVSQRMNVKQKTVEDVLNEEFEFLKPFIDKFGSERINAWKSKVFQTKDEILGMDNLTITDTSSDWFQDFLDDSAAAFEELKNNYDVIVVDFFQNLFSGGSEDVDTKGVNFMQKMQRIFKGSNTSMVWLAQKHKTDLRAKHCPDIDRYVDVQLTICRKTYYSETVSNVLFVPSKNRFGPDDERARFEIPFVNHATNFISKDSKEHFEQIKKYAI